MSGKGNARLSVVEVERKRLERYLVDRGWHCWEGEWRHPNLTYGWTLDNALQLEADAEADDDFADMVHGMLRGVY